MTATVTQDPRVHAEFIEYKKSKLLLITGIVALAVGFGAILGGAAGAWFTWNQAAAQDITTPSDAVIPDTAVRGPLTMWAQSDIITHHQLDRTDGLYFSQMPRMIPMVDANGAIVVDETGEPVMVPNDARASWLDATTLTTALNVGILSYALAAMAMAVGTTLALTGFVILTIRKRAILL